MNYFLIEPEVAGGFGERTVIDRSSGRMEVKKLHYQFDGWLGDELLESVPCFIVTMKMAHEIERERLTGVAFDDVEVTTSDEFNELFPAKELPVFRWLKVTGTPGKNDFGLTPDLNLVVSDRALHLLQKIGISHAVTVAQY